MVCQNCACGSSLFYSSSSWSIKHKAILVLGAFVLGNGREFFIFSKEAGAGVPTNPTIDSRFRENEGRWCRNEGGDMEIRVVWKYRRWCDNNDSGVKTEAVMRVLGEGETKSTGAVS